jgi:hypothetical protein
MDAALQHPRRSPTPARLVGLLADDVNLKVVAALVLGAASAAEIEAASGLDAGSVERSLERLSNGGLVVREPELRVDLAALRSAARRRLPELPGATAEQAAVLRNFVDETGRVPELPARAGRRRHLLEYVTARFEPGREYREAEVNDLLGEIHDDYATLRRYLVDERLLERSAGIYRRAPEAADLLHAG